MVTIYQSRHGELETIDGLVDGCWASLIDPTPEEIAGLQPALAVPERSVPNGSRAG